MLASVLTYACAVLGAAVMVIGGALIVFLLGFYAVRLILDMWRLG